MDEKANPRFGGMPLGFEAGDANLYRYVNNQPTTNSDPSGLVESPIGIESDHVFVDFPVGSEGMGRYYHQRWLEQMRSRPPHTEFRLYGMFGRYLGLGGWGDPAGAATAGGGVSSHGNDWYYSWVRVTNIGGGHNYCNTSTGTGRNSVVGGIGLRLVNYAPGTYRVTVETQGIIERSTADFGGVFNISVRSGNQALRQITLPAGAANHTSAIQQSTFQVTLEANANGWTDQEIIFLEPVISINGDRGDFIEIYSYVRITNIQRIQN